MRRTVRLFLLGTSLLLASLAAIVVVYGRRHEHKTLYADTAVPWHHFSVADAGQTLVFTAFGGPPCLKAGRVHVRPGPVANELLATLYFERPVSRDGHDVVCGGLTTDLPTVELHLNAPLEPGTVVVDGAPVQTEFCSKPIRQSLNAIPEPWPDSIPSDCR